LEISKVSSLQFYVVADFVVDFEKVFGYVQCAVKFIFK